MTPSVPTARPRLLYRLQQVDSRLAQTEERLRTLDAGDALREQLRTLDETLAATEQDAKAKQAHLRALELELQSTVAKRKRVEEEMYSGRVRNPKELASMQEEVTLLDRHTRGMEDAILALMQEVEDLQGQVQTLTDEVIAARAALAQHESAFARDQVALEAALAALRQEREEVAAAIDADLLRRYDRIRDRMGDVAVAAVRKGICEGCHVAIPEGRVRRLQEEEDLLLTCERCGRILVLSDE